MSDKTYILIGLVSAFSTIIVAIISQIIGMHIKAKSQIRQSELELYFKERNKAYHDFICSYGLIFELGNDEDKSLQFLQCYYVAYLLATDITRNGLKVFFDYLENEFEKEQEKWQFDKIGNLFDDVCESMRDDLQYCYASNYKRKKAKRKKANPKKKPE